MWLNDISQTRSVGKRAVFSLDRTSLEIEQDNKQIDHHET